MEALALERKAEMNRELRERLVQLKKERNAIILAHYYQRDEIQEVADFRGDSFLLAQKAASTDAETIVFCGVHFMGESANLRRTRRCSFPTNARAARWPTW
ncbi:hypothetical protein HMSSN139_48910 [Paenibacillus sp. HMSSN-139]|nr:hypothetical protein HMSSN139_48910 [Paenibacillus sp. HMSSN-139]